MSAQPAPRLVRGLDLTDMLLDCLADPTVPDGPQMRRIANLPVGAARKA